MTFGLSVRWKPASEGESAGGLPTKSRQDHSSRGEANMAAGLAAYK